MPNLQPVKLDHEAMMDCIHCGLCLSQCPTYAEDGLEADSPRGRIYLMRALAEGRAEPTQEVTQHFDSCLGCRACETACPSGVKYGHLIENTREFLKHEEAPTTHRSRLVQVLESVLPHPSRLDALLIAVRIGRATGLIPLARRLGLMKLLGPMGAMEASLPPLRPFGTHRKFPEETPARGAQSARVAMATGCVLPVVQPQVNEATARVLAKAGCHVAAPKNQRCCGAMHAHSGDMDTARSFARHNIALFEAVEESGSLDAVIINAAGCGAALKEYGHWLAGDDSWRERAQKFASKVRDVSEFLAEEPFANRLQVLADAREPSAEEPATRDAPREVVPNIAGASSIAAPGRDIAPQSGDFEQTNGDIASPNGDTASRSGDIASRSGDFASRNGDFHSSRRDFEQQSGDFHSSGRDNRVLAVESDAQTRGVSRESRAPNPNRATYHDACHLAHGQGIRAQPRKVAKLAADGLGIEMVALPESEMCCGSAGTYNILQPEMAGQLLNRKMQNILGTGAGIVVSSNIGCTLQLRGGAVKSGAALEVLHPVELLDRATGD